MPGVDWLPGVSQLKSIVQLASGDVDGAKNTQINFLEECPGISQATSFGQLLTGNREAAIITQKKCLSVVNNLTNGIPIIGHIKGESLVISKPSLFGAVHYAAGDKKGSKRAVNAASRSAVVIGGGAILGLTTGGPGAISAGIAAGALYDSAGTVITGKRQGLYAAIDKAVEDPNASNIFELVFLPLVDGIGGYTGGKLITSNVIQLASNKLEAVQLALDEILFITDQSTAEQLLRMGTRVSFLKEQLNFLKHGATIWFDSNTGGIFTKNPSSSAIPGYLEKFDEKEMEAKIREIYNRQRDAILSDEYSGLITKGKPKSVKEAQRHKQQTAQASLFHIYPAIPIFTEDEMYRTKLEDRPKKDLGSLSWYLVRMPIQLNYTCVIMKNHPRQGLLHTFLRRSREWANVIPGISEDIQNISIEQELYDIGNASNPGAASSLLNSFDVSLQKMDKLEIECLEHMQIQLYNFVNTNIKKAKYFDEDVNDAGRLQVFFKIRDSQKSPQIMVICMSDELYLPDDGITDPRPIRAITTVFFKSRVKGQKTRDMQTGREERYQY